MSPPEWNPYMTYVWTQKQMRQWVDYYGARGLWDGKQWKMIYSRICPGRYDVRFEADVPATAVRGDA